MTQSKDSRISYLESFLTERRKKLYIQVASKRVKNIRVVLEDLYDPFNVSACLRTCEAYAIQHIHIIDTKETPFKVNRGVTKGCEKWIDIHIHHEPQECIQILKNDGFAIIASDLGATKTLEESIADFKKIALFFGNEHTGISQTVLQHADGYFKMEMFGFTGSFNVGASVAIALTRIYLSPFQLEHLSEQEINQLYLKWLSYSDPAKRYSLKEMK